jgi:hypothetical protein
VNLNFFVSYASHIHNYLFKDHSVHRWKDDELTPNSIASESFRSWHSQSWSRTPSAFIESQGPILRSQLPATDPVRSQMSPAHIYTPYFFRTDVSNFLHVCLGLIMDLSRNRMCVELIDLAQDRDRWRALLMRSWTFGSYKMRGISGVAENMLTSQEGLCSME